MTEQRRPGKYPAEMRDRAVRMVFEAERHCDSQWEEIRSVADKLELPCVKILETGESWGSDREERVWRGLR